MNTRIRARRSVDDRSLSQESAQPALQRPLDRRHSRLLLPAAKRRAVVGEEQREGLVQDTPDVDARRVAPQPDALDDVWEDPATAGEPAAAQCPARKFVYAANGFWRVGPTLYKFPYVQSWVMVARPAAPCVHSL